MERSNEKALKIIEQQYESFINLNDHWDFFRGLAEYTKTLGELVPTQPLVEALERQQKVSRALYEQMNTDAFKELTLSAERITAIAQNVLKPYEPLIKQANEIAKTYEPIVKAVKEVQDRMNGLILSSNPLYAFDSDLFDVARHIKASGHEEAVKEFEDNKKKYNNIYGNFTFSPTYEKISDVEIKLERKEQVEPWGAWHQLPLVKRVVFEPDELKEEFKAEAEADPNLKWTYLNFVGLAGEMEKIRTDKVGLSDNDVVYFRVKDFRSYAQRVHTYITAELLKTDMENSKLEFDVATSALFFANEKIKISDRANSDAHDLLKIIFSDISKLWNNDEILEKLAFNLTKAKVPKNKVYQAGKAVNRIIAQETTIKDFLILTTKTVAINKKYLK